ncbi:O-antigen ligase-like membrane protein [Marinobacter pelagius]|uniref:O-antigen ligase-like membrane protein n=1 Tax=Marinobacter pelagius TaxID=379482 RepID=A0A366GHY8_9GAMM|nr:O-antigen ligase family protein [Marinobacter pelagius]RBP25691.1 O-antigen ligase-like membrane protein [Marinobacter pelagius]
MNSSLDFVPASSSNAKVSEKDTRVAFILYSLYLVSFFMRLPARMPLLGAIRFDLILVAAICYLVLTSKSTKSTRLDSASQYLLAIFIYAIVTLPLVEWPGSVINNGLVSFIKGAIFYFFTVNLVVNSSRLKIIISIFVGCNIIRIMEPLFLNITTGYLGSATYLGQGDFAGRLAGAPADVINPNGLAFVIATVTPFLHYVFATTNKKAFALYLLLMPLLLYTMGLTLSRSGMLALAIIALGIWWKSAHKFLLLVLGTVGLTVIFLNLNDVQKDRYLSIISDDARQSLSAQGRIEGWAEDFKVAMNRPIIGHGLGTSREANWNVAGKDQISHILWMEIWQEIGLIGLVLFILYLSAMIRNFREASKLIKKKLSSNDFLYRSCQAMQVWLLMNLLFSLASYGLKSYEWYLFGGLSVVLLRAVRSRIAEISAVSEPERVPEQRGWRFGLARRINRL